MFFPIFCLNFSKCVKFFNFETRNIFQVQNTACNYNRYDLCFIDFEKKISRHFSNKFFPFVD